MAVTPKRSVEEAALLHGSTEACSWVTESDLLLVPKFGSRIRV